MNKQLAQYRKTGLLVQSVLCMLLSVVGALAQRSSQTERDFATLEWYASNEGSASIYGEDISVSFEEVPLIQAINELANQVGVRLSYNQKELPNKKITLVTDNISVIQAFKRMFQATGLD